MIFVLINSTDFILNISPLIWFNFSALSPTFFTFKYAMFKNYLADMFDEFRTSIDIYPNNHQIFNEITMPEINKLTIDTAIKTAKVYIEYIT